MTTDKFRIVFMGTPGFAVSSLDALVKARLNVVAVITAPDKPAGRGLTLKESEVKQYAVAHNIPVLQPEKLKDPAFIQTFLDLKPDLAVVVAFRMLPEVIWSAPKRGTINLHASLLPQYRGAAPINWAIINGETKTGVTTFFIEKEIDTGKIIGKKEVEIFPDETAETLHDKLAEIGSRLLVETVIAIRENTYSQIPQNGLSEGQELKPAPKIFRENCRINWDKPVKQIYNHIRGLCPYPGAWTMINTPEGIKTLKIYDCKPVNSNSPEPGKIIIDKSTINISGNDGFISVQRLQLEGKKAMKADEFIRGLRDTSGLSVL